MPSPSRAQRSAGQHGKSPSPKRQLEKTSDSTAGKEQMLDNVKSGENIADEKNGGSGEERPAENDHSAMDVDSKVDVGKASKRPRDETGLYTYIYRIFLGQFHGAFFKPLG